MYSNKKIIAKPFGDAKSAYTSAYMFSIQLFEEKVKFWEKKKFWEEVERDVKGYGGGVKAKMKNLFQSTDVPEAYIILKTIFIFPKTRPPVL